MMIEDLYIVEVLRSSPLWYGAVNAAHILGIALLIGTIVHVDLRIIGLWRGSEWKEALDRFLPMAWAGFALAVSTGFLLVAVRLSRYLSNPAFQIKMGLLGLALVNILIFHRLLMREHKTISMRLSAMASLALWIGILCAGRAIGFV